MTTDNYTKAEMEQAKKILRLATDLADWWVKDEAEKDKGMVRGAVITSCTIAASSAIGKEDK